MIFAWSLQMKCSLKPWHQPIVPLPVASKPFEHIVLVSPDVVADGYHGGVHVAHAIAPTESTHPQKEHHDEEHTALQLHEAVVRDCRGEEILAAAEDVVDVEMLEALVPSKVEHQLHGHNLAVGHGRLARRRRCLPEAERRFFSSSESKFLLNSSTVQKISVILSSVIIRIVSLLLF